ncbi:DUF4221 family protein [Algoriphagus sp.]|uniref:DUF4221 family protein n=1 Tax=Algoriphagus sp. TaxID=1872435 RepID=UPI0039199DFD
MRQVILLVINILWFVISCKPSEESAQESGLILLDTVNINLDGQSAPSLLFNQVTIRGEEELLVNLNQLSGSLDLYDLATGDLNQRVAIPSEGPNAIMGVSGFYVLNSDSVFLFPKMSFNKMAISNLDGSIVNSFSPELPLNNEIGKILNHSSTNSLPTFFHDGKIYFDQLTLKNTTQDGTLNPDFKVTGFVDFGADSIRLLENSGYPYSYLGKTFSIYAAVHSRVLNDIGKLVYSWGALDSLVIVNSNWDIEKKVFSRSKFKSKDFPETPNASLEQELEAVIGNGYYGRVMFDPFRNLYYRFYHIGRTYSSETDNSIASIFKNDFSVLVYNQDFEFLSETKFEGKTYDFYQAFIGQKGLYLPKLNQFYDKLNEDYIVCDIYVAK